jgi:hypothetical protein
VNGEVEENAIDEGGGEPEVGEEDAKNDDDGIGVPGPTPKEDPLAEEDEEAKEEGGPRTGWAKRALLLDPKVQLGLFVVLGLLFVVLSSPKRKGAEGVGKAELPKAADHAFPRLEVEGAKAVTEGEIDRLLLARTRARREVERARETASSDGSTSGSLLKTSREEVEGSTLRGSATESRRGVGPVSGDMGEIMPAGGEESLSGIPEPAFVRRRRLGRASEARSEQPQAIARSEAQPGGDGTRGLAAPGPTVERRPEGEFISPITGSASEARSDDQRSARRPAGEFTSPITGVRLAGAADRR